MKVYLIILFLNFAFSLAIHDLFEGVWREDLTRKGPGNTLLGPRNNLVDHLEKRGTVTITVFKNKLLTKVDAPKNRLAHENRCIKRPSQLRWFRSISLDFFP